jgi:3D (Asp-Asp-Asp) domain-containing protein
MKWIIALGSFTLLFANHTFASEEFVLARITGYWRAEGCGEVGGWSGTRLQPGDCAVDPKRIPFGSKIIFPDKECLAVDTGSAVVSRKSARYCGHTAAEKNAIVIDRFFETKADAVAWTNAHPQFITVRVVVPENPKIAKRAARQRSPLRS